MSKHALVIVHLSSIDSYRSFCGRDAASELADALEQAAKETAAAGGLVYVVDQFWSSPLRDRVAASLKRSGASFIRFDENKTSWEWFLPRLAGRLRRDGTESVMVAGIWFDPELKTGCATTVYLYLRSRFNAVVDQDLVACECDDELEEDEMGE